LILLAFAFFKMALFRNFAFLMIGREGSIGLPRREAKECWYRGRCPRLISSSPPGWLIGYRNFIPPFYQPGREK
jgi:hypothetical protein